MIWRLVLGRTFTSLGTLLLVSIFIFAAVEVLPGDIARQILGRGVSQEQVELFRQQMGFDRPAPERYLNWLGGLLQGDLGHGLVSKQPVLDIVAPRLYNTLLLAAFAFIIYIPLALSFGIVSAVYRGRAPDNVLSMLTLIGLSIPEFVLGTILLIVFAANLRWFPALALIDTARTFGEVIKTLTLPAVTLAVAMAVYAVRMLRDNLIEVLDSDYVRMATLKGLPRYQVVLRHALPNALGPALNVTALNLVYLIGGVVIVERIFAYPGLGSLLVDAISLRDAPLIEAAALLISAFYILANLLADVAVMLLNPRLRTS
jgi:peptide/nickel transport system permease protein